MSTTTLEAARHRGYFIGHWSSQGRYGLEARASGAPRWWNDCCRRRVPFIAVLGGDRRVRVECDLAPAYVAFQPADVETLRRLCRRRRDVVRDDLVVLVVDAADAEALAEVLLMFAARATAEAREASYRRAS